jgi:hypothetical protein
VIKIIVSETILPQLEGRCTPWIGNGPFACTADVSLGELDDLACYDNVATATLDYPDLPWSTLGALAGYDPQTLQPLG